MRCNPNELKNRLNSRNYNDEKIKENLEAEALNIISDEAIEQYNKVLETLPEDSQARESVQKLIDEINLKKGQSSSGGDGE